MREVDLEHGNNDGKLQRKEAEHLSPRYKKQYEQLLATSSDKTPLASKAKEGGGQSAMHVRLGQQRKPRQANAKDRKFPGAKALNNPFADMGRTWRAPEVPASFSSLDIKQRFVRELERKVDKADLAFELADNKVDDNLVEAYGPKKGKKLQEAFTAICQAATDADAKPWEMDAIIDDHWRNAPEAFRTMLWDRRERGRRFHALDAALTKAQARPVQDHAAARAPVRERVVYRSPPPDTRDGVTKAIDKCGDIANSATENFGVLGFAATYPLGLANFFFGD
jgi:hypothetical protein